MANQAIALQSRAPQGNFLAPAIQQGAQFINMMSQQRAAERQAAAQQQQLDIARTQESRAAALAVPQLNKATSEATAESLKTGELFNQAIYTAAANSNSPEDFLAFAQRIAAAPQFQNNMFLGGLKEVVASLPADPAQFPEWQRQTGIKTVEAAKRYKNNPMQQNLGTTTRVLNVPEYGGGAAQVVPGSEAAVTIKPTVLNVEGIGGVIVDPNTGRGFPIAAGQTGGYTPPGLVGGDRGGGVAATPVATALQTNPGAIRDGAFARSQPGYAGASGGFATFNTPQEGAAAQENLLRKDYVGSGINTVNKIIDKYTPASKENPEANRNNYKNYVAGKLGINLNAPITAAQVPALAAAMREFETGQRPARAAAPAAEPKTINQVETEKAFKKTLPLFGYNPDTGTEKVSDLISASTSGGLEKIGSDVVGFVTGEATPGRQALGQLETIKDNMTFEKLRGKLGAQISNADVQLVSNTMADIANPDKPANQRLASWQNVVLPILLRGAGIEPKAQPAAPSAAGRQTPTAVPVLTPEQVRANPNIKRWRRADNGEVMTRP
jgi:hypothetical protein